MLQRIGQKLEAASRLIDFAELKNTGLRSGQLVLLPVKLFLTELITNWFNQKKLNTCKKRKNLGLEKRKKFCVLSVNLEKPLNFKKFENKCGDNKLCKKAQGLNTKLTLPPEVSRLEPLTL